MNVLEIEQPVGVVCQFGGQTAIKLAKTVREAGYSILGTDLGDIDAAEDRELFNELLNRLGIPRRKGTTVFPRTRRRRRRRSWAIRCCAPELRARRSGHGNRLR